MLKIDGNSVKLDGKFLGKIDGNVFISTKKTAYIMKNYNAFTINAEVLDIVSITTIKMIFLDSRSKEYSIEKSKLLEMQKHFNLYIQYKGYEPQLVIPIIMFNTRDKVGKSIEEFKSVIKVKDSSYRLWKNREKGKFYVNTGGK